VPAGQQVEIPVLLDATDLSAGHYRAGLLIGSNDPLNPTVSVGADLIAVLKLVEPPDILGIEDVSSPPDQGGWVTVTWQASQDDAIASEVPISFYSIWLRNTAPAEASSEVGKEIPAVSDKLPVELVEIMSLGGEWIGVGSLGATQDSTYTFPVHTLADSNYNGINWSYLRVSAHSTNPFNFAYSAVDSGYSVDNISPGMPDDLRAESGEEGIMLKWNYDMEAVEDFQYFAIYRAMQEDFAADVDTFMTTDTLLVDSTAVQGMTYYYMVTAIDYNGNCSEYAGPMSAVWLGLDQLAGIPEEFALSQNYPNPFNPSTAIRFDLPIATDVHLVIYNLLGREVVRLVDNRMEPAYHQVIWNGRDAQGRDVPTGIYIARLVTPEFSKSIKMVLLK
jgi:hypothetical protein